MFPLQFLAIDFFVFCSRSLGHFTDHTFPCHISSSPLQDELKNELEELEQQELNERLVGADHVPVHTPASVVSAGPSRVEPSRQQQRQEDDEDAELRALQAEMAM